jgi:hypothetical protein
VTATSHSQAAPRKSFALLGRSRPFDPTRNAVRGDIADVRLAEHVFAPHYAAPLPRRVLIDAVLRAQRGADSAGLATLAVGDTFELLDVTGDSAWGVVPGSGLVGYLDAAALGPLA